MNIQFLSFRELMETDITVALHAIARAAPEYPPELLAARRAAVLRLNDPDSVDTPTEPVSDPTPSAVSVPTRAPWGSSSVRTPTSGRMARPGSAR